MFNSDVYKQVSELAFEVIIVDFTGKEFLDYNSLDLIEVPVRESLYPTPEEFASLSLDSHRLSEIRYK